MSPRKLPTVSAVLERVSPAESMALPTSWPKVVSSSAGSSDSAVGAACSMTRAANAAWRLNCITANTARNIRYFLCLSMTDCAMTSALAGKRIQNECKFPT